MTQGGIFPAIFGTFLVTLITALLAVPLGMCSAIYLNEYARQGRLTRLIRLSIRNLSGVPSIVYGLFGVILFVNIMRFGTSVLSAGLTLGLMTLPWTITASEEALKTVPNSYREGALALGATKWQSIRTNVLPYAVPGMLTGTVLGLARAAGETAPILFTGAAFFLPYLPKSLGDQFMALPYHLYIMATQHHQIEQVRPLAYGTALVLIVLVLGMNMTAVIIRYRLRRKQQMSVETDEDQDRRPRTWISITEPRRRSSNVNDRLLREPGHGHHRSVGMRQVDVHPDPEPNERRHPGHADGGRRSCWTEWTFMLPDVDVVELRRRVGMVFQKPNPFPKSIFDNIAYGLRINGMRDKKEARGGRRAEPPRRGALGRGQGPARRKRLRPVRRPAAAPLHRPGPGRRAGGHPLRRAVFGHRPHRHGQDRGLD